MKDKIVGYVNKNLQGSINIPERETIDPDRVEISMSCVGTFKDNVLTDMEDVSFSLVSNPFRLCYDLKTRSGWRNLLGSKTRPGLSDIKYVIKDTLGKLYPK